LLLRTIACSYFIVFLAHSLWRSSFYNYSIDEMGLGYSDIAFIFSAASIPGVFSFLLGFVASKVSFHILAGVVLCVFGMGLIVLGLGFGNANYSLMIGVVLISLGFTWYLPIANYVYIGESRSNRVGMVLGRLKSLGPLAGALVTLIYYQNNHGLEIAEFFLIAGFALIATGVVTSLTLYGSSYNVQHQSLHFDRRLWPYYALNFISGSRSALFKTFILSQFVFVSSLDVAEMSLLIFIGSIMVFFSYRMLGYLSDRFGSEKVLRGIYLCVTVIFTSYALLNLESDLEFYMAVALFMLDSILFGTSVITDSYLKNEENEKYLVCDLATGSAIFHAANVIMPLLGGLILAGSGNIQTVLILGIGIALAGVFISFFMTKQVKVHAISTPAA
jgi:MFS family permease